jgi:cell wall-associated NlpC family hydrolase
MTVMQVAPPIAKLLRKPSGDAMQETQALLGERVEVSEVRDGWASARLMEDGYAGFMRLIDLSPDIHEPTHRIAVLATHLYPKPDLKSQPALQLTFNSKICATDQVGDYLKLAAGGYVFAAHAAPVSRLEADPVAAAERFLNVPYLWGGKGAAGIDCSGLVQVAMQSAGIAARRDADMQEESLGVALQINDLDGLRRGDLVFWDGHVGIMSDRETLLHANGHHMMVVKEPLRVAIARIATPVTALKRV